MYTDREEWWFPKFCFLQCFTGTHYLYVMPLTYWDIDSDISFVTVKWTSIQIPSAQIRLRTKPIQSHNCTYTYIRTIPYGNTNPDGQIYHMPQPILSQYYSRKDQYSETIKRNTEVWLLNGCTYTKDQARLKALDSIFLLLWIRHTYSDASHDTSPYMVAYLWSGCWLCECVGTRNHSRLFFPLHLIP